MAEILEEIDTEPYLSDDDEEPITAQKVQLNFFKCIAHYKERCQYDFRFWKVFKILG